MAKLIKTTGEITELPNTKLETLQDAVGGDIELVALKNKRYMIVNEMGKVIGLDINPFASQLLASESQCSPLDYVVGNAVICGHDEVE